MKMIRHRRLVHRLQTDSGVTTIFVAMFAMAVLLMVGMVYEGGRFLEAKRSARHAAVGAARAGAQALNDDAIRGGDPFNTLDDEAAQDRACVYLATTVDAEYEVSCGDAGTYASATADRVTVQVSIEVETPLLSVLPEWGSFSRTVTEQGHACAEAGITQAGDQGGGPVDPLCD